MQIKTTIWYHLTLVRMASIKITVAEGEWSKENHSTLLVGLSVVAGIMENSMEKCLFSSAYFLIGFFVVVELYELFVYFGN